MKKRIAIVGAGVSGLAAAWALREAHATVTVFDKIRGVSGRAASRSRHGVRFDHGANYFKTDSEAVARLVLEELPPDDLVQITRDVWTFDGTGTLSPGDLEINAEPKWTYSSGISTLGKLIASASGAEMIRWEAAERTFPNSKNSRPGHGVYTDVRTVPFNRDPEQVRKTIWRIGGKQGWYSADWAWRLRGWIDRLAGGSGLRRGRRDPEQLRPGDALDFWRVLVADEDERRLLLFAEMKLPGEAWLEFRINPAASGSDSSWSLVQTATFRPRGLLGRLYWYSVLPMHHIVFETMARELVARDG